MFLLYHFILCPRSRFVRLVLGEYSRRVELIDCPPWKLSDELNGMNPEGKTPVLLHEDDQPICGAQPIAEYLDEVAGEGEGTIRLMPPEPRNRAEIRRLCLWFHEKFDREVTNILLRELVSKRFDARYTTQRSPDSRALISARHILSAHLKYMAYLLGSRSWLAGETLTFADFSAAAQISTIDYLGHLPWSQYSVVQDWYVRLKSRPSFRVLLADVLPGLDPSAHYVDLDF